MLGETVLHVTEKMKRKNHMERLLPSSASIYVLSVSSS